MSKTKINRKRNNGNETKEETNPQGSKQKIKNKATGVRKKNRSIKRE